MKNYLNKQKKSIKRRNKKSQLNKIKINAILIRKKKSKENQRMIRYLITIMRLIKAMITLLKYLENTLDY